MRIETARGPEERKTRSGWIRQLAGGSWLCAAQPAGAGPATGARIGGCEFDYDYYVSLAGRRGPSRIAIQGRI